MNSVEEKLLRRRFVSSIDYNGRLYLIENVDAEVCRGYGELYFRSTTLDAIDRLLEGDHPVKDKIQVEVINL